MVVTGVFSFQGMQFQGSLSFKKYGLFYTSGGAVKVTENDFGRRYEATTSTFSLGLGGRVPIGSRFDLFAIAGPSYSQIDFGNFKTEYSGYFGSVGVRTLLAKKLDLALYGQYSEYEGFDDTSFTLDARYWFSKRFAVSFNPDSDVNSFGIGFSIGF